MKSSAPAPATTIAAPAGGSGDKVADMPEAWERDPEPETSGLEAADDPLRRSGGSKAPESARQEGRLHWATSADRGIDDYDGDDGADDALQLFEDEIIPGVDDLPLFANEQSKALDLEIKKNEKLLNKLASEVEENAERVKVMKEHMGNVKQEVQQTNALVAAKAKENATEVHMRELALREVGKCRKEGGKLESEVHSTQDHLSSIQNGIFKASELLDEFRLRMNWNQEELEQWAVAEKQKEEDTLALQKYTRADEARIKELMLRIETLTKATVEQKALLEAEATETQAKQIELDKVAAEFRDLHGERQKLIGQWQESIETMKRRDDEVNQIGIRYAEAKRQRLERFEVLKESRAQLKGQMESNAELHGKSEKIDRVLQKRREEQLGAQVRLQEFKDELEVMRNELESGATSLAKKRHEVCGLGRDVEEKTLRLQQERERYQKRRDSLAEEAQSAESAEDLAKAAEDDVSKRSADVKHAEAALKRTQHLFTLRQEEANLVAEIAGARSTLKSVGGKITELDTKAMRQQELIYNAEFQIQQMERKVARGLGERTDDEKRQLNAQIAALEDELGQAHEQRKMLTQQCRKLNNELRAAIRTRDGARQAQSDLGDRIAELKLENGSADRQLRKRTEEREETMVQHDVMRLEIKRLRDALTRKADEVFSLENRRQQLQLSMEERKAEIRVHQEVQRAQLRAAEEERHKAAVELGQRKQQVAVRRSKYESLAGEGKVGESSQAYFVIQMAQRREELQRTGDELDHEIRILEREIRALHNTLQHLTERNTAFRQSFQKASPASDDAADLAALEAQVKAEQDRVFRKKKELQRAGTDVEEDRHRIEQVQLQKSRLEQQRANLIGARRRLSAEVGEKRELLAKASSRLQRLRQSHRANLNEDGDAETLQEKVFRTEALTDTAGLVLYTLGQLAQEYPEMAGQLHEEASARGLDVPPLPPRAPSS